MSTRKLTLAATAAFAALAIAGTASATNQDHFFVFKNNTSETLTRSAQSMSDGDASGSWVTLQPSPDPSGGTKSGDYRTDDFDTINYSDTWSASDGTYCTFSIYSALNAFNNLQFYESTSKGGLRASSVVCTITAPRQPYSTHDGNVEMDYNVSGF